MGGAVSGEVMKSYTKYQFPPRSMPVGPPQFHMSEQQLIEAAVLIHGIHGSIRHASKDCDLCESFTKLSDGIRKTRHDAVFIEVSKRLNVKPEFVLDQR